MEINGKQIGDGNPCYVIAEMSANHGQDKEKALEIIEAAKRAGADAVKLQTYTPDTMTIDCDSELFQMGDHKLWGEKTLYQLYKDAYTPWEWHEDLKKKADQVGITLFSTPFDATSVDFLEEAGVDVYKVASFELVDDPLLKKIASTRKPIIMSAGMATLDEIEHALEILKKNGAGEIALLKCVSAYPALPEEMNLAVIADMKKKFSCPAGLSDHTVGSAVAVTAVALGANVIEKHFKLNKEDDTCDSAFSSSADEFKQMVDDIRIAEKSIGKCDYERTAQEADSLRFRRSIFVVKDVKAGDEFSKENIRVIRPGQGMTPSRFEAILGKKASVDIRRGFPLNNDLIEKTL